MSRSKSGWVTSDSVGGHQDAQIDVTVSELVEEGGNTGAVNGIVPVLCLDQEERWEAAQAAKSWIVSNRDVYLVTLSEIDRVALEDDTSIGALRPRGLNACAIAGTLSGPAR
jgi:hypothetical protein